ALAQFIVADDFAPVEAEGPFAKSQLDPGFVAEEEARVTRGYLRLRTLPGSGLPLTEYPLPEVRARWQAEPPTAASPDRGQEERQSPSANEPEGSDPLATNHAVPE